MRKTRAQITAEAIELGQRQAYTDAIRTLRIYREVLGDARAVEEIGPYMERMLGSRAALKHLAKRTV